MLLVNHLTETLDMLFGMSKQIIPPSLHHVVFYTRLMKKMEVKLVYLILTQRLLKSTGRNLSDIKKVQNNKIV